MIRLLFRLRRAAGPHGKGVGCADGMPVHALSKMGRPQPPMTAIEYEGSHGGC